jgi:hypothetical protein
VTRILVWAIVGAGAGQAEFGSEQKCLAAIGALKALWPNDFRSYWGVELTRVRSCRIGRG